MKKNLREKKKFKNFNSGGKCAREKFYSVEDFFILKFHK